MATIYDKISSDSSMSKREKKYWARVQERTGLTLYGSIFYDAFTHHSDMNNGLIMFGDTKHDIANLLGLFCGDFDEEKQKIAESEYQKWLKFFREKGLIHQEDRIIGETSYPVLSGYNPLNDPEIYVPCRRKGEDRWSGRMSIDHFVAQRDAGNLDLDKFEYDISGLRI